MSLTDTQRQSLLRQLWMNRPDGNRTATDVLIFYGDLERQHPELIWRGQGDPYQHLKSDLAGLID